MDHLINIIYEDEQIAVIIKPPGVNSEGGNGKNVAELLKSNFESFIVHRLDREVSGLMVVAKNELSASILSKQIQDGTFKKEYLSVVAGEIEEEGTFADLLFHDRTKNKTYVVKRERKGVKKAILNFKRLGFTEYNGKILSKVRISLKTGRTHQIRVQFGSRKHSVFGDRKYGSEYTGNFALFSAYLSFRHPKTQKKLEFSAEPCDDVPWNL